MKALLFVIFSAFSFSSHSHAGANSSGGGPSIVCPSASDPVASAQILDLFEGKIRYNTPAVLSEDPVETQLDRVTSVLKAADYALGVNFEREIAYIFAHSKFLPANVGMQVPLDVGSDYAPVVPEGCHLEAVGYYNSSGELVIAQTLLSKMDHTNQAAFYTHEALYELNRVFLWAMNSERTRQVTSLLFSANANQLSPDVYMPFTWNLLQMPDREFLGPNRLLPVTLLPSAPDSIVLEIHNPEKAGFEYHVQCLDFENQKIKEWRNKIGTTVSDPETSLDLGGGGDCRAYSIRIINATIQGFSGMSAELRVDETSSWNGSPQNLFGRAQINTTVPIYVQESDDR